MKGKGSPKYIAIMQTEQQKAEALERYKDSNIFYSLGVGAENVFKKYSVADIKSLDIVPADIDRNYEENIKESEQILEQLGLSEYVSIFKSGTGYWLLFKLSKLCKTEEEFKEWKKVILILIKLFNSDKAVKNIDRLCRVSGSTNQKQKAKGAKAQYVKISEKTISLNELYDKVKHIENTKNVEKETKGSNKEFGPNSNNKLIPIRGEKAVTQILYEADLSLFKGDIRELIANNQGNPELLKHLEDYLQFVYKTIKIKFKPEDIKKLIKKFEDQKNIEHFIEECSKKLYLYNHIFKDPLLFRTIHKVYFENYKKGNFSDEKIKKKLC